MAQPHLALGAVPRSIHALLVFAVASTTSCPLVLGLLAGIFLGDGRWKVTERERTDHTRSTTSSSSTTVVADQLTCQLQSELLDGFEWSAATVALLEDECVGDGIVQQEVKNILVELSTFGSAAVVASNLITPINSSHEIVVLHDR